MFFVVFTVILLKCHTCSFICSQEFYAFNLFFSPILYLCSPGLFMLILSPRVKSLLGDNSSEGGTGEVCIFTLTAIFVILNFLAATQDIAVDGWALTMLSRFDFVLIQVM